MISADCSSCTKELSLVDFRIDLTIIVLRRRWIKIDALERIGISVVHRLIEKVERENSLDK